MKRRILLSLLWLLLSVNGALASGMLVSPCGNSYCGPGLTLSPTGPPPITSCATVADNDIQTWCTTVTFANTNASELAILQTMSQGIKLDLGITTLNQRFDRMWLHATSIQTSARVDLANRQSLTEVPNGGTLLWTALKGYQGDGTLSYLNTGWPPSTGPNFTQNSGGIGAYVQTFDNRGATAAQVVGGYNGSSAVQIYKPANTTQMASRIDGTTDILASVTQGPGLYYAERTGASAQALYKSGTSIGTSASGSSGLPAFNIFVLAQNSSNTPGTWSNATIAFTYACASLGATAVAQVSARVKTALQAISLANFP